MIPTKHLNKKNIQQLSHKKLQPNVFTFRKVAVMSSVKRRNTYQHMSDFDRSQHIAYRDCRLLYRGFVDRVCLDL